jgi:hypothetical protein
MMSEMLGLVFGCMLRKYMHVMPFTGKFPLRHLNYGVIPFVAERNVSMKEPILMETPRLTRAQSCLRLFA